MAIQDFGSNFGVNTDPGQSAQLQQALALISQKANRPQPGSMPLPSQIPTDPDQQAAMWQNRARQVMQATPMFADGGAVEDDWQGPPQRTGVMGDSGAFQSAMGSISPMLGQATYALNPNNWGMNKGMRRGMGNALMAYGQNMMRGRYADGGSIHPDVIRALYMAHAARGAYAKGGGTGGSVMPMDMPYQQPPAIVQQAPDWSQLPWDAIVRRQEEQPPPQRTGPQGGLSRANPRPTPEQLRAMFPGAFQ